MVKLVTSPFRFLNPYCSQYLVLAIAAYFGRKITEMASELDTLLPGVAMRPPFPTNEAEQLFADFITEVGPIPHRDYLAFMREHNGCDGPVGRNGNVSIWPLEEVILWTDQYKVSEQAPGLLLFGTDGGNEAFAFDRQAPGWPIVSVPLVGMSRNEMKFVAPTFTEFIKCLAADELPI